jgi:hypothetical protein
VGVESKVEPIDGLEGGAGGGLSHHVLVQTLRKCRQSKKNSENPIIGRLTLGVSPYVSVSKRLRSSSGHGVDWRTGVDCQGSGSFTESVKLLS